MRVSKDAYELLVTDLVRVWYRVAPRDIVDKEMGVFVSHLTYSRADVLVLLQDNLSAQRPRVSYQLAENHDHPGAVDLNLFKQMSIIQFRWTFICTPLECLTKPGSDETHEYSMSCAIFLRDYFTQPHIALVNVLQHAVRRMTAEAKNPRVGGGGGETARAFVGQKRSAAAMMAEQNASSGGTPVKGSGKASGSSADGVPNSTSATLDRFWPFGWSIPSLPADAGDSINAFVTTMRNGALAVNGTGGVNGLPVERKEEGQAFLSSLVEEATKSDQALENTYWEASGRPDVEPQAAEALHRGSYDHMLDTSSMDRTVLQRKILLAGPVRDIWVEVTRDAPRVVTGGAAGAAGDGNQSGLTQGDNAADLGNLTGLDGPTSGDVSGGGGAGSGGGPLNGSGGDDLSMNDSLSGSAASQARADAEKAREAERRAQIEKQLAEDRVKKAARERRKKKKII